MSELERVASLSEENLENVTSELRRSREEGIMQFNKKLYVSVNTESDV